MDQKTNFEVQPQINEVEKNQNSKSFFAKLKNKLNKKYLISAGVVLVILVIVIAIFVNKNNQVQSEEIEKVAEVEVSSVGDFNQSQNIEVVGVVKPETSVDVVALNSGNVQDVLFFEGDNVIAGQLLASLYDNATLVNNSNAQIAYNNAYSGYLNTESTIQNSITQAEISLQTADSALKMAQINYDNGLVIQEKNTQTTKESAVASLNNFLNLTASTLDQVDYIIGAEHGDQMEGLSLTLGAKNHSTLNQAKTSYFLAKKAYTDLMAQEVNTENIDTRMTEAVGMLDLLEENVEDVVDTLEATVPHVDFNITALSAQKTTFVNLRTNIINTYNSALSLSTNLNNLDFYNQQEREGLKTALDSAQAQYDIAKVALESAQKGLEQQLLAAQSSLDGARGQLNLSQYQVSNLSVEAPITGKIAKSYIEVGQEIGAGQKVAQIYRDGLVKIEINLSSDEVYKIKLGQWATINGEHLGTVSMISPSADPQTRKVAVEVVFDNTDKILIPETFVDVSIEVLKDDAEVENKIYIPLKTVSVEQDGKYVFIIENETAKKIKIETGDIIDDKIEVLSGLNLETQIVTLGQKNISDGEVVKIK